MLTQRIRPIDAGTSHRADRIALIDSLRAIALLGVIIMNVLGMTMRFAGGAVMAKAGMVDLAWMGFDLIVIQGKARACFALLFGVGMAIQMQRASAHGDFAGRHVRRMLVLLAIGAVNQALLFWGDILMLYALLGLATLSIRNISDRAMLTAGLSLVIAPPIIVGMLEMLGGSTLPAFVAVDPAREAARGLAAMTSPHYADFVRFAATQALERRLTDTAHMLIYDLGVLGLFLVGSWVGRRGILSSPTNHLTLLRRIAIWCLPVGLALSVVNAGRLAGIDASGPLMAAMTIASAGIPIMAFGVVAMLTLIFSSGAQHLQSLLAPVGRMALTNYLLSGVIGCWFHYGYGMGLLGKLGLVEINLFALALFALLIGFSHLWLSVYRLGPVEWLWRSAAAARPMANIGMNWLVSRLSRSPRSSRASWRIWSK